MHGHFRMADCWSISLEEFIKNPLLLTLQFIHSFQWDGFPTCASGGSSVMYVYTYALQHVPKNGVSALVVHPHTNQVVS